MTQAVLIAGCGDLGWSVAEYWQQQGRAVFAMRRTGATFPDGVTGITGDIAEHGSDTWPDVGLIYLIMTPQGRTEAAYRQAYVETAKAIIRAYQHREVLPHIVFVSSTSVYGQDAGEHIDEASNAIATSATANVLLEAESVLSAHLPTTSVRCSGIYGPGRFRLLQQVDQGGEWGENRWTNRIHRDDVVSALIAIGEQALGQNDMPPHCIATDTMPVLSWEVRKGLSALLKSHRHDDVTSANEMTLPPANTNTSFAGKQLCGHYLSSIGWTPRYPTYLDGYQAMLPEYEHARAAQK